MPIDVNDLFNQWMDNEGKKQVQGNGRLADTGENYLGNITGTTSISANLSELERSLQSFVGKVRSSALDPANGYSIDEQVIALKEAIDIGVRKMSESFADPINCR